MLPIKVYDLGQMAYEPCWQAMRDFTNQRTATDEDEIWLVEHPAIFTQGQAGKQEHVLNAADIRVLQTDRGGQVTYHGPGQLVIYPLLDVRRLRLNVRQLVTLLEQSVIALLGLYRLEAHARADAPGVYLQAAKICSVGLRIRKGCSYHGLALNVAMDLEPFTRINPCGLAGLEVTQMSNHCEGLQLTNIKQQWVNILSQLLNGSVDWMKTRPTSLG